VMSDRIKENGNGEAFFIVNAGLQEKGGGVPILSDPSR